MDSEEIPQDVGMPGPPEPGEKVPQPKKGLTDKAAEAGKDVANKAIKKGVKQLVKTAARAVARAAASAVASAAAAIGWPWAVGCIIIFVIVVLIFGVGLGGNSLRGMYGRTIPHPAGTNDPNLKALLEYQQTQSRNNYHKVDFLKDRDIEYLKTGKPDYRLLAALKYIADLHERIRISHLISDYEDMDTNPESGADTDPQIIQNISAHVDGEAADIDEIDFVFKVFEDTVVCDQVSAGTLTDIVYYNDLEAELFRLRCLTPKTAMLEANTTFKNRPAVAIPIEVRWQDKKPTGIKWLENVEDPGDVTDPIAKEVYQKVFQPEARRKVHLVMSELLQFPYDLNDTDKYRVTQLITFSKVRDVDPFEALLDRLYGANRPPNFGLFNMNEAWWNIHIGY
jgi:hypothetical protein